MSQSKEIKHRIKSIQNTKKITKAMELVAASKMRKAVSQVVLSRNYSNLAWNIIEKISLSNPKYIHPLLKNPKKIKHAAILVVSSNRGLCGAFNGNVLKKCISSSKDLSQKNINHTFLTFGRKVRDQLRRLKYDIAADFDKPDLLNEISTISPISKILLDGFVQKQYQAVYLVYTDFVSTLKQQPIIKKLLPLKTHPDTNIGVVSNPDSKNLKLESRNLKLEYKYEPSPKLVLDQILPRILELQIYQAVLESDASEHSARMLAMKNAHKSATDMIDSLNLAYNQARQAAITQELAEIVAGANAI